MFVSVPGLVPQDLQGPGRQLVNELKRELKGKPVELFAPYAGQAAAVLLNAIASSGERAGVIGAVRKTKVQNGIIGSFRILASGDPNSAPITVSVARSSFVPSRVITPGQSLVTAARGG
jgi:ABC-type branched-subunit amino acid transport system substrate-binding protein